MGYGDCYRDFRRSKRQPKSYLPTIEKLKQSLTANDREQSLEAVRELERIARKDRIHSLEEYLLKFLSRLLYIQGEAEIMEFTYSDTLFYLNKIHTFNRIAEDVYYIAVDDWHSHFDAVLSAASELASEACMTNECREWSGEFDRELLWKETSRILAFTYLEDETNLDRELRSLWSNYTFFPY
ncbi:MAG: hypothetical protein AAGK97_15090 [Bacteroidota bacterium]